MANGSKKNNHPLLAYVIGLAFLALTVCVGAGVAYHLTVSHHGPGLLRPLVQRHKSQEIPVLTTAQRQAKLDRHDHFHNLVSYPQLENTHHPVCLICHSELPHNKNKRVRALLNMHSQYLACETCHLKPEENQTVVYQWASPIDPAPEGPFIGTRYDAKTGYLAEVDDKLSKIAPFYKSDGRGIIPAISIEDRQPARDFMDRSKQMDQAARETAAKVFHRQTEPKGLGCQTCHAKKGIIDYRSLQFSDKRIADLEHLNITGMLARYETWYLPDLLSESRSKGETVSEGAPKP